MGTTLRDCYGGGTIQWRWPPDTGVIATTGTDITIDPEHIKEYYLDLLVGQGELPPGLLDTLKKYFCLSCGRDDPYCPCERDE